MRGRWVGKVKREDWERHRAIASARNQRIFEAKYQNDLTLVQIGRLFDITGARVRQILLRTETYVRQAVERDARDAKFKIENQNLQISRDIRLIERRLIILKTYSDWFFIESI